MSKRVDTAERAGGENENYPTPAWCVHRLLDEYDLPTSGEWLEPAVGDGAIVRAVRDVLRYDRVAIDGIDIRPECGPATAGLVRRFDCGSFLDWSPRIGPRYDVVITNPPFSLAQEFVDRARELAPIVVMLLRMNWLGSEKRAEYFRSGGMPAEALILPNRPGFTISTKTGKPGSDSTEYAWMVFTRRRVSETRVRLLRLTDLHTRKPWTKRKKRVPA